MKVLSYIFLALAVLCIVILMAVPKAFAFAKLHFIGRKDQKDSLKIVGDALKVDIEKIEDQEAPKAK